MTGQQDASLSPVELHYRALVLQCSHPGGVDEPNELVMALWTDDQAPQVAGMSRAERAELWADLEALADRLDPWITHQAKPRQAGVQGSHDDKGRAV